MTGQEHVTDALRNAISQGRFGQAYLLTGPKGTGKTTTARIMAKAVNCAAAADGDPCDECETCQSISRGANLDVVEIDAARNRGIDEIRDLRDSVRYLPSRSRRKVYIIDEVHMLTQQASNAFLKTLEEPPDHAMFVLCTTQPDSILPTITSRCQRLDFRRLSLSRIAERLRYIADQEDLPVDDAALRTLARAAGGSMRDAQNLLETLCVGLDRRATRHDADTMLGLIDLEQHLELAEYLLQGAAPEAIAKIEDSLKEGIDSAQMHAQTLSLLRHALLISMGNKRDLELPEAVQERLQAATRDIDRADVTRALDLWQAGAPRPQHPDGLGMELAAGKLERAAPSRPTSPPAAETEPEQTYVADIDQSDNIDAPQPSDNAPDAVSSPWNDAIRRLDRTRGQRYYIGALLRDCRATAVTVQNEEGVITLPFRNRTNLERLQQEMNAHEDCRSSIERALSEQYGTELRMVVTLEHDDAAPPNPADSPVIQTALRVGARIVHERS